MVTEIRDGQLVIQPKPTPRNLRFSPAPGSEELYPSTFRYDRGEKRDIYGQHGVKQLWLCDPKERLPEAIDLVDGKWLLQRTFRDGEAVDIASFDAAPVLLGRFWAQDGAQEASAKAELPFSR